MTVSSETTRVSYAGDGSTVSFSITFTILAKADLVVILRDANNDETVETLDSAYTINDDMDTLTWIKGVAPVVPPASGETLLLIRGTGNTQGSDFVENDPMPAETIETALDRLTMLVQQQKERLDRAPQIKRSDSLSGIEISGVAAGEYLRWNLAGTGIDSIDQVSDLGTFLQSGTGAVSRTAMAKMGEIVSLKDFAGVDPTGASDSSTGIKAAANASNQILVPDGTYLISNITGISNIKFIGNKKTSIFKHMANATDHMLECSGDVEFDGITIDGNKANQTGRYGGVYFDGDNLTVTNCIIKNTVAAGLYIQNCQTADITHNQFLDIAEHGGSPNETAFGIYMPKADNDINIHIIDNKFINSVPTGGDDLAPSGIFISGTEGTGKHHATITGNYFKYFGTAYSSNPAGCIDLYLNADSSIISNNRFEKFHYTPILTSDSGELIVSENIMESPGYDFDAPSINIQGKSQGTADRHDVIVSDNIIDNQYGTGISVTVAVASTTKRRIIKGNDIKACTYGIFLSRIAEVAIVESNIIDATYSTTSVITVENSSGSISINSNNIYNILAGVGIFARTGVTSIDFIINNNIMQSDGTADMFLTIQGAASCVCNGNRFIGDDIPVDFATVTPLTLIGNQSDNLSASFGAGLTTKINYGNSWDFLQASDTWDPGSIADGDEEAKAVTVTGAVLGDYAVGSFSLDVADLVLNAQVTATNTVTCVLANNTGDAVDLAEGTVYVRVMRR